MLQREQCRDLRLEEIDDEGTLIEAMVEYPRLIERPVVIKSGKTVLRRPPEKVLEVV